MIENESNIALGKMQSHAVHHKATGNHFVVIAPPLYEEGVRLRKVLVNVSRYLCERGYDVVRFDYFGTGFSPGDDLELTLSQAKEDLEQAVAYCGKHGAADIAMLGVRFGAYLALSSRINNPNVERVVAWEPITDPGRYLRALIRSEATSQMFIYGKILSDQEQLLQKMANEGQLYIEGYCVSSEFSDQLNEAPVIDDKFLCEYRKTTKLIYWQSGREHKYWLEKGFDSLWPQGVKIAYSHIRYLDPAPEALFKATLAGIGNNG